MGYRYNTTDIAGQKFNGLTVLFDSGLRDKNGGKKYLCVCDCGKQKIVRQDSLKSGHVKSCGCFNIEAISNRATKHGQDKINNVTTEYNSWHGMMQRCYNKNNKQYYNYGGRGIAVCGRWRSFKLFFADMGKKPSKIHSLDRYPNKDGNYEPANCRWATDSEQSRNKRTNVWYEYNGRKQILSDWVKEFKTASSSVSKMISKKPFDEVVEFYRNKNNNLKLSGDVQQCRSLG